ncbi:immediate early response 3-interacting protein 1 [Empidonax traillii]|uniref:immediate early response 3-interacting protein 1 n=1 Tax=Empidonax traillii TaxID=164674 RepID=UPI000FFD0F43|nr:immediate early response 3-interacting protein 1 [Empidonax traillii]
MPHSPPKCVSLFLCDTVGWGTDQGIGGFGEEPGIKAQLMNLIRSVRTVMRVPLIALNSITIVLLLLFG